MIAVKLSGPIGHDETGKVTSGKMVRLAIFWTAAVACRTFDLVLFPTAYPVPYCCCENDDLDSFMRLHSHHPIADRRVSM